MIQNKGKQSLANSFPFYLFVNFSDQTNSACTSCEGEIWYCVNLKVTMIIVNTHCVCDLQEWLSARCRDMLHFLLVLFCTIKVNSKLNAIFSGPKYFRTICLEDIISSNLAFENGDIILKCFHDSDCLHTSSSRGIALQKSTEVQKVVLILFIKKCTVGHHRSR